MIPCREALLMDHYTRFSDPVQGELMHRFGNPRKGFQLIKGEPVGRGDFVLVGGQATGVDVDLVTKEHGGSVRAKRRSDPNQANQLAFKAGFFSEFTEGGVFGAFVGINVSFRQSPTALMPSFSFLNEEYAPVLNNAGGYTQVAHQLGHRYFSVV